MEKIFFFCMAIIIAMLLSSCRTSGIAEAVIEHQRAIDAVETERAIRNRAIESSIRGLDASVERLKNIARRSEDVGAEIDDIIFLFDEYNERVEQFICDYNNLKANLDCVDNSKRDMANR